MLGLTPKSLVKVSCSTSECLGLMLDISFLLTRTMEDKGYGSGGWVPAAHKEKPCGLTFVSCNLKCQKMYCYNVKV